MEKFLKKVQRKKPKQAADGTPAVPRITNDTVAEHREQVLKGARKYIYPLQHSKRRVVTITASLLAIAVVAFFVACVVSLYRFQTSSAFMYDVTKVIPFPVAKADGRFVSYESYLFELRRYEHYYENQQKLDLSSEAYAKQLASYKKVALDKVVNDAYVKELAAENNVTVSDREVDDEVTLLRSQNRLGTSDQVFEDVLEEYWGWSVDDFKRELKTQLLSQKVAAALDTETKARADQALAALNQGTDFATVAQQYSDDQATKANGGNYASPIDRSSQTLQPQVLNELFRLKAGETSGIINAGDSLQIVRVATVDGTKVNASVIVCTFKPIASHIDPLKAENKPSNYISV